MEQLKLSNTNIDLVCEQVDAFLKSVGVEGREVLRIKLTLEEVLLEFQGKFGEDECFKLRCIKSFFTIKVELSVKGMVYNPLEKDEDESVIQGVLATIGFAPTYAYKNGKNYVIFTPKKKPLSSTVKMGVAIGLALIFGLLLNLLPSEITDGVNAYMLTPVTDAFIGLISAVSVPLIFLSILASICSMGNMEVLGKIGSKTIRALLLYMALISIFMTALGSLFCSIELGGGTASGFSQILNLIYDIVPSNLFEPFVTGNTLQLIFISVVVGLAMLVLSSRVNGVFRYIEQLDLIVKTIMSGLSSVLPVLIFVLFTGMISSGTFDTLLSSWKMLLVIALLIVTFFLVNLLRISAMKRVSPLLLFKKIWPTLAIAFSTASSAAAFGTNVHDTNKKLGVHKTLAEFGIPIGQVLFDPASIAILTGIELTMAQLYGVSITPSFLITMLIVNPLLALASPPVPGGSVMSYAIAFAQLGLPMEAMGVVLVADMLLDFPATACNVSVWQLTMVEVADSLDMLNKETLRK